MSPAAGQPFNMAEYCIGRAARATPEKPALLVYDAADPRRALETYSFFELEQAVLRLAGALGAQGLVPGDRIAIRLGNTSHSAILFFAAIAGGFVALPVSDQLTPAELDVLLEDSGAAAIARAQPVAPDAVSGDIRSFSAADIACMIETGPPALYAATLFDTPAFLVYTSGTTARPKGVLHAHRSAWGRRPMYDGWYGIGAADRMLHAGAFNWTYTLGVGLTDPWANGATAIVAIGDKRPDRWPALIRETGATLFAAVPGVYRQMLKYAPEEVRSLGALRHGLMAGETPPDALFDAWTSATGLELYEALGMSEISTYISTAPSVPRRAGAVGKAQAPRRVAILAPDGAGGTLAPGKPGLIAVHRSDPGLMLGYWNRPAEEAEVFRGDWFAGGDLGSMDDDGYVTHLGRTNELMNAGGYRVSPLEVEAVIARCPGVAEVACAEIPVRAGIAVIGAFIVPDAGCPFDEDRVRAFAADHLAAYKCPREIVVVEQMPRTSNGKVLRRALAAIAAARKAPA